LGGDRLAVGAEKLRHAINGIAAVIVDIPSPVFALASVVESDS